MGRTIIVNIAPGRTYEENERAKTLLHLAEEGLILGGYHNGEYDLAWADWERIPDPWSVEVYGEDGERLLEEEGVFSDRLTEMIETFDAGNYTAIPLR